MVFESGGYGPSSILRHLLLLARARRATCGSGSGSGSDSSTCQRLPACMLCCLVLACCARAVRNMRQSGCRRVGCDRGVGWGAYCAPRASDVRAGGRDTLHCIASVMHEHVNASLLVRVPVHDVGESDRPSRVYPVTVLSANLLLLASSELVASCALAMGQLSRRAEVSKARTRTYLPTI